MNARNDRVQIQMHKSSELRLNAPIARVWPFIQDFSSFNDTFDRVEVIEGQANTVGAVSRLTKSRGDWWMEPYLVKIVHIEPGRQLVWKMYSEKDDSFTGFVDFNLREDGAGTIFQIRLYKEQYIGSEADIEAAKQAMFAASHKLESTVMFPNLKRLVESPVTT